TDGVSPPQRPDLPADRPKETVRPQPAAAPARREDPSPLSRAGEPRLSKTSHAVPGANGTRLRYPPACLRRRRRANDRLRSYHHHLLCHAPTTTQTVAGPRRDLPTD